MYSPLKINNQQNLVDAFHEKRQPNFVGY